ncbi:hypothetical protein FQR65_LT18602 [Abscondita terminalis]|nr:hypothetical protein FQR65_LT18602 [Abscondita terminalis]
MFHDQTLEYPKGKLYDKLRKYKKDLKKEVYLTRTIKQVNGELPIVATEYTLTFHIFREDITEQKIWLKIYKEESDWPEIVNKWKKMNGTKDARISHETFDLLIEEWPLYKHPRANHLKNSKRIFLQQIKDKHGLKDLNDLNSAKSEDSVDLFTTKLLHYLIKPTCRIVKKDKKIWKPSILDSQESQFLTISIIADL